MSPNLPGIPGTLHGRPTRRLETAHCWVEFLTGGGPRILGFGLSGGPNILAETPDKTWDSGYGTFELIGGHRLWFAPESPECSVPDSTTGLEVSPIDGGVRLAGAIQEPTGLRKSMDVVLAADAAGLHIRHVIRNEGSRALDLAPWPVTQLRLGGTARVALPGHSHSSTPTQLVVMWPYSSWQEKRLSIRDGEISVAAWAGEPFKVGCLNYTGRVTYELDDLRFTKSYDPALPGRHTDLGCNLEIYVDEGCIELESLAPLTTLVPGEEVAWDEDWELTRIS